MRVLEEVVERTETRLMAYCVLSKHLFVRSPSTSLFISSHSRFT